MPAVDKGLNDKSKDQIVQDSEVSGVMTKGYPFFANLACLNQIFAFMD